MKKLLPCILLAFTICTSLMAQDSTSRNLEIGLISSDFVSPFSDWYPSYLYQDTRMQVYKWNLGLDIRRKVSKSAKLRINLGYQERISYSETTQENTSEENEYTHERDWTNYSYMAFYGEAGLVYQQRFGKLSITAGPEVLYVFSIVNRITSGLIYDYKNFTPTHDIKREYYVQSTSPTFHQLGAGFFIGVNYMVFPRLTVSCELRQMYMISFARGKHERFEANYSKDINGKESGLETTHKNDLKYNSNAFVYALPSVSIRWLW